MSRKRVNHFDYRSGDRRVSGASNDRQRSFHGPEVAAMFPKDFVVLGTVSSLMKGACSWNASRLA